MASFLRRGEQKSSLQHTHWHPSLEWEALDSTCITVNSTSFYKFGPMEVTSYYTTGKDTKTFNQVRVSMSV